MYNKKAIVSSCLTSVQCSSCSLSKSLSNILLEGTEKDHPNCPTRLGAQCPSSVAPCSPGALSCRWHTGLRHASVLLHARLPAAAQVGPRCGRRRPLAAPGACQGHRESAPGGARQPVGPASMPGAPWQQGRPARRCALECSANTVEAGEEGCCRLLLLLL
jgi:hypothetical protein